jgi:hypothetical protein
VRQQELARQVDLLEMEMPVEPQMTLVAANVVQVAVEALEQL